MLHSILLDMGNDLLRYAPEHFLDRLEIHSPQDRAFLLLEIFHSPSVAQAGFRGTDRGGPGGTGSQEPAPAPARCRAQTDFRVG